MFLRDYLIIINIVSDNGLAPSKLQAITQTNVDQDICCHMASLGHNEFITNGISIANMVVLN